MGILMHEQTRGNGQRMREIGADLGKRGGRFETDVLLAVFERRPERGDGRLCVRTDAADRLRRAPAMEAFLVLQQLDQRRQRHSCLAAELAQGAHHADPDIAIIILQGGGEHRNRGLGLRADGTE